MNEDELLYLLKHGRAEDVRFVFKDLQEKHTYSEDFPTFIDTMIKEYKVKRKEIAIRSGMSQDYTYKLLRGDKKTTERDYILAICIAIGMNLAQVQHALRIYGMPVLSSVDLRSHIIALAISEGKDVDEIDDWLEKSGFYLIKTNPDMPSAPIKAITAEQPEMIAQSLNETSNILAKPMPEDVDEYEEVDKEIHAERCGNAPMDYMYWGEIKIQNDEGNAYYVRAAYHPEGEQLDVMTERMHEKYERIAEEGLCEEYELLEQYESLSDAAVSPFFRWFLELDRATDQKVLETMRQVDDTRGYGVRYGAKLEKKKMYYYMEAFNTQQPERREYFQIIECDEEKRFTASHESYYMWLELGDIYTAYFTPKMQEPEFFINVKDLNELEGKEKYYKMIFHDLLTGMHQFAHQNYGLQVSEEELESEKISSLTQQAVAFYHSNKLQEAISALEEAYDRMKKLPQHEWLSSCIVTCSKLADHYRDIGDDELCDKWYQECLSYNTVLQEAIKSAPQGNDSLGDAPISMAYAYMHFSNKNLFTDRDKVIRYLQEAIVLFEGRCNNIPSWGSYAYCLTSFASQIDGEEPERALEYTEKALDIVRDQGLDRIQAYHNLSYVLLNNHGWVLWNKLSSEEAIIYYGRAIDLIEGYLVTGTQDPERMKSALAKEAWELYKIYKATNKEREADRLLKKMKKSGIDIENM